MGDPTEQSKGDDSHDLQSSDNEMPGDSENEDIEAEQVQPATVIPGAVNSNGNRGAFPVQRHQGYTIPASANTDTVHSILSSIANPNAAFVIPVDGTDADGDEDIDAERMERFYTGALSAITKMRRQTVKAETKIDTLRNEVGHTAMQAWTNEHFDSLQPAAGDK